MLRLGLHFMPLGGSFTCSIYVKYSMSAAEGALKFQGSSSKLQAGSIFVVLTIVRIPHYRDLTPADEEGLLARHLNRVTDTCIPEEEADHVKVPADLVLAAGADNHIDHGGIGRRIIGPCCILGFGLFTVQRNSNEIFCFSLSQVAEHLRPVPFNN